MDSFRGSLPPQFNSFHLGNQIPAEDTTTIPEILSPPVSADSTIFDPQTVADLLNSPRNAGVEKDIETATEMSVRNLDSGGLPPPSESIIPYTDVVPGATSKEATSQTLPPITTLRTSTPVPATDEWTASASLAALESGLQIAETSASQLPELLPASNQCPMETLGLAIQTDDDNDSSLYEVPALPSSNPNVRFLTDLSESEKTVEETSSTGQFQLYGNIPHTSESGTEAGEESSTHIVESSRQGPSATTPEGLKTPSRSCLEEPEQSSERISTEPEFSSCLLDILQWFSLNRKYTTSCGFLQTKLFGCPMIPWRRWSWTQSGANPLQRPPGQRTFTRGVGQPLPSGDSPAIPATRRRGASRNTDIQDSTDLGEAGDSSSFVESDSAGEMALITAALNPGQKEDPQHQPDSGSSSRQAEERALETDPSSQDIPLSEVRDQALDATSKQKTKAKGLTRPK